MSVETTFFIYLIEHYAEYKNTTADCCMRLWDELNLTDFIRGMYEMYHSECLQNAYDDIDRLVSECQSQRQK